MLAKQRRWKSLFFNKDLEHVLSYLFGPHTINDGVERGWNNQVEVGNKNVDIPGYVVSKSVREERKD